MSTQRSTRPSAPVTTGIPGLDACLGAQAGDVVLVAGEGAGAAGLKVAIEAARAGQPAFFFSRALDERGFRARVVAELGRLPLAEVLRLEARRADAIGAAALERVDVPLYRGELPWETARDIAAQVAPSWFIEGSLLVVIDDASALRGAAGAGAWSAQGGTPADARGLRAVCRDLKHAACALDAAVIACVPTEDGSRRAAKAACCLSMLADEVVISRIAPIRAGGAGGGCIELHADRCRGGACAPVALEVAEAPSARGGRGGGDAPWDAFALRESA